MKRLRIREIIAMDIDDKIDSSHPELWEYDQRKARWSVPIPVYYKVQAQITSHIIDILDPLVDAAFEKLEEYDAK